MKTIRIPDEEYLTRAKRASQMVAERGLDALFLFGSEGDFQNVRYFTSVTPIWERLGVVITAAGKAAMLTGPEGLTYCQQYCKLDQVFALNALRSSMDPIPGKFRMTSFQDVLTELGVTGAHPKIAIGNPIDTTTVIEQALHEDLPGAIMRPRSCACFARRNRKTSLPACARATASCSWRQTRAFLKCAPA